jgi:hypothetical protein
MKTLAQIEPRTAISALPYTISDSGSYYLTTNLVGISGNNGINIAADNVTLDLNGFCLIGVPGSLNAIVVLSAHKNLSVRNGSITGWPNGEGLVAGGASNSQFEGLRVRPRCGHGLSGGKLLRAR